MNSSPDYLSRFFATLSEAETTLVAAIHDWCERRGIPAYLVGGSVRDLLMGRPHLDVDLAVDGDAVALGRSVVDALGGKATVHEHFGTAAIEGSGCSIDVARTRGERYSVPGALPEVVPASIADDLARRDFTMHAMALTLNGKAPGDLLDPFGGTADVAARILRVLHADSFRDDPTRILRLARYAARLNCTIESETGALARRDATFLGAVSQARVAHELERTLSEAVPERALAVLAELRALDEILPAMRDVRAASAACRSLRQDGGPRPGVAEYLCALAAVWTRPQIQSLAFRLQLERETLAALHGLPAAVRELRGLGTVSPDPVATVESLEKLPLAAVRGAGAALGDGPAHVVRRYLNEWRSLRPTLRGEDLIALGVAEGPAVGGALRLLRKARLRGELHTAADERTLIQSWLVAGRAFDSG